MHHQAQQFNAFNEPCSGCDRNEQNSMKAPAAPTISATVEVLADDSFSTALLRCKQGVRITRAGWNGAGQFVFVSHPSKVGDITSPFLALKNTRGEIVPWAPSQGDLFANDWAALPG